MDLSCQSSLCLFPAAVWVLVAGRETDYRVRVSETDVITAAS